MEVYVIYQSYSHIIIGIFDKENEAISRIKEIDQDQEDYFLFKIPLNRISEEGYYDDEYLVKYWE